MSSPTRAKTIGLSMIVKNEAHLIVRCLDSVRPLIDYVLIEDTGSTDGTQETIRDWLSRENLPGAVIEEPWRDFAYNRSHALAKLREVEHVDYALIIDADDVLVIDSDVHVDDLKRSLAEGSYTIDIRHGPIIHRRSHLCSNKLPFLFRGAVHEFLDCRVGGSTSGHLEGISIRIVGGGARSEDSRKFQRDAELIETALSTEEDAFLRSRYTFYLAQSYRDSGDREKALQTYLLRAEMGFWAEEIYVSLLQAGRLKESLGHQFDDIIATYQRATDVVPTRAEAIHGASHYCRMVGRNREGYDIAKRALDLPMPAGLFIEEWIYEYGLLDEFAINAYWAGEYADSLSASLRILEVNKFPANQRPRIIANAKFAQSRLGGKPNLGSAAALDYIEQYPLQPARTLYSRSLSMPRVLLAILAKQKEAELALYLECINNLVYPKSQIVVYIRTNNNTDRTRELLEEWVNRYGRSYASVELDDANVPDSVENFEPHEWNAMRFRVLGAIRNDSLRKTLQHQCDFYFVCDVDNFIRPRTLVELVALDLPICAPFLRGQNPNTFYSNYHAEIDQIGYFLGCDQYNWILNRYVKGVFEVPVVHCTYLVRADVIDRLTYIDGSNRHEYVVFSDSARKAQIPQYIDNRQIYGYMVFNPEEIPPVRELMQRVLTEENAGGPPVPAPNSIVAARSRNNQKLGLRLDERLLDLTRWRDLINRAPDDDESQFFDFCLRNLGKSKSQNFQELFVLYELDARSGGFFVEFGAGDGVYLSNTHTLEFQYGWKGILAEPAKCNHKKLRESRNSVIDDRCVWNESGLTIPFIEAPEPELSTMTQFINSLPRCSAWVGS